MAIDGDMEYALARVQAHYGRRLRESDWRRLETTQTLGQYLEALRNGTLADWVLSLDRTQDCHAIDRTLRNGWRRYVGQVAAWHSAEWQPWIAWLAWLPTLSLLAQLARSEPAPAWMMADPVCGPIAPGSLPERIAALRGTPLAAFEPGISGRAAIDSLWRERWLTLEPRGAADIRPLLDALLRAVDTYRHATAHDAANTTVLRQQLTDQLTRLFRTGAGTVVATICHLGLMIFELQRLRGGLINRCVFAASD